MLLKFIYSTRHGTFFHLTPANQCNLKLENVQVSAGDFAHMEKSLRKLEDNGLTFKKYIGLDDGVQLFLTAQDSYKPKCIEGSHLQMTVKLWQNIGFKLYNIDQHNRIAELIKPDYLVSLTETPGSTEDVGIKSSKRAVDKSLFFLENSLQYFQKKEHKPKIMAAIQGGCNQDLRTQAVYYTIQTCYKDNTPLYDNFGGMVFYGLDTIEDWDLKEQIIQSALKEISSDIREDLKLVLGGRGDLMGVLWGISWEFDDFEIEYPYQLAQRHEALLLNQVHVAPSAAVLEGFQDDRINFFEMVRVPQTLKFPIDNAEHKPIDEGCGCFTCLNHSQLYISHLVQCKEMNSSVLLSIHNTYQYTKLLDLMNSLNGKQRNQWIRWYIQQLA